MSRRFKEYDLDQDFLLPPSIREWLPTGDLVYFLLDVVQGLDLSQIYKYYEVVPNAEGNRQEAKAASGQPPFDPTMMVALLLYAYCSGTASSRRIAWLCERDIGYRVLTANLQPNFRTISEFRRIHLEALKELFVQVLQLARVAGLVKLGHVCLDGTKVKANASKHKAMSYGRMKQKEAEYRREIKQLLETARQVDAVEDRRYGKGHRGDELPAELQFRETRLQKIREAKRALEETARERAAEKSGEEVPKDGKGAGGGSARGRINVEPKPKEQRNFTDPDSRIMKMGDKAFDQAYNCQAAVDAGSQIIVARLAVNAPNDKQQLKPMVEQIKKNLRGKPKKLSADSGYYSEDNVLYLQGRGIDAYICPDRLKHGQRPPAVRGRIPEDLSFSDRVRRKLNTNRGRRIYGKRKGVVEPVFGQIKHARRFRQFLLRGLEKADGEWSLWCTTHNLLKLWAAQPV
jgi:transposase